MLKNGKVVFVTLMVLLMNNVSKRNKMQMNNYPYNFYKIFTFQNEVCKFNYDYDHAASSGKIENPVALLCASLRRTPGNKKMISESRINSN